MEFCNPKHLQNFMHNLYGDVQLKFHVKMFYGPSGGDFHILFFASRTISFISNYHNRLNKSNIINEDE